MKSQDTRGVSVIAFPLRGAWKVFPIPGHPQHAYDFVGLSDALRYMRANTLSNIFWGGSVEDWHGWGRPIFAPVDGEVIQAEDGWEDRREVGFVRDFFSFFLLRRTPSPNAEDPRSVAGNFVTIKMADGRIVFMCHMKKGSVRVTPGMHVREGEKIGEVGNSGNSMSPHLHLNIFEDINPRLTGPLILHYMGGAHIAPFSFARVLRMREGTWTEVRGEEPRKREIIKSTA